MSLSLLYASPGSDFQSTWQHLNVWNTSNSKVRAHGIRASARRFLSNSEKSDFSLVIQWLWLCASHPGGLGSIPDWGTNIPHAMEHGQKLKKKKENHLVPGRSWEAKIVPRVLQSFTFILHACVVNCLSVVWLFETPGTVAHQDPLSMGFPRQEYWSGLPFPPPGDLPNPGIELVSLTSPALAGRFFTTSATWQAHTLSK